MIELATQPFSIVLEIANICTIVLLKQDDDDTGWDISKNKTDNAEESTMSSDIEEDNLENQ
jgi:hypothetical protein